MQESLDESPVEIPKSQNLADFFDILRCPPVLHSGNFDRVHSNRAIFQYNSQEFNSFDLELTLSWLQI